MMPAQSKTTVLIDGGFLIKKWKSACGQFPTAASVASITSELMQRLAPDRGLLRHFFYHATPASGEIVNPISKQSIDLARSDVARQHHALIRAIELLPDFAVRLGESHSIGWRIGDRALKNILRSPRAISAQDLVPDIKQKGVDLRIGLDMSRLALSNVVDQIIVVTGDSDLVPAFKFVRREGLRVALATLGHNVRRDLKVHADIYDDTSLADLGMAVNLDEQSKTSKLDHAN